MESWVKGLLDSEREKRKIPLEAKLLNGNYYLYGSTTTYDKESKRIRKVSRYIGRMTKRGVVEKRSVKRSVYEYGNSQIIKEISGEILDLLKKHFPDRWNDIYAYAVTRLIGPAAMRSVSYLWDKLYMSRDMDANVSPEALSELLHDIGSNLAAQISLFSDLMRRSGRIAYDLSSVFSRSPTVCIAARGHNHEHMYVSQVSMALIFDVDGHMPVSLLPVEGSVRDVKSLRKALEIIGFSGILVLDRGFTSEELAGIMGREIRFIMPLRRNQKEIEYTMHLGSSFMYRDRGILAGFSSIAGNRIYVFLDPVLAGEESSTFISLIKQGRRKQSDYDKESMKFGKIAMLSNIDDDPESIYLMYKQREEIEQAFDAMKNELENDKTYLRNDESVRGYFFISFISLYLYYRLFMLIRAADLTGRYSVKDVLTIMSKVYSIVEGDKEHISEIPKIAKNLDEKLSTNIFPKN